MSRSRDDERKGRERRAGLAGLFAKAKHVLTNDPTQSEPDDRDAIEEDHSVLGRIAAATSHARLAADAHAMRAAVAKSAQVAAYRESAAGPELTALWDRAAAMPAGTAERVFFDEFAQRPSDVFAQWQAKPLAAASLGQVHAAELVDGRAVVVKVQYPGMREALASDLKDPGVVRRLLGPGLSRIDDADARAALVTAVAGEVDYRAEAAAQRVLAGHLHADDLRIPDVIDAWSGERVLTMSRATGAPLYALWDAPAEIRDWIGDALLRFHLGVALRTGYFNADPHPGNTIVDVDAHVVWCLDFGCTIRLQDAAHQHDRDLWRGLAHADAFSGAESFRLALAGSGLLGDASRLASAAMRDWEALMVAPMRGRAQFTPSYADEVAETFARVLATGAMRLPPSLLLLWRQRISLWAVLGRLRPTVDLRSIVTAALRG